MQLCDSEAYVCAKRIQSGTSSLFFLVAKKFFEAALPFSIVLFLSIGPFPLSPLSLSFLFLQSF